MDAVDHKLIAATMLSVLSFVIVVGMFLVYLVLRTRYMRELEASKAGEPLQLPSEGASFRHSALKRPTCWLAIKNCNLQAVQAALTLHNPKPCTWVEGLAGEGGQKLFVSPPVSGWVLVLGQALPDPGDDVDVCFRFLLELSRKLGHVQFFNANAMLNQHAWVQADSGRILRGYAWAARTLWNQGPVTPAERDLKMRCYDYTESADPPQFTGTEPPLNNAEKVHLLAARWSVDPDEIDERFIEHEWGIAGDLSRLF